MSITAHTATPYSLGAEYPSAAVHELMTEGGRWTEVNAKDHSAFAFIVTGMTDGDDSGVAQATAEFIVRACNSHDVLVQALKNCVEMLHLDGYGSGPGTTVADAEAALANAGAQ
ncbi:MAG: hypothetical protein J0I15_07110 [Herbaspirillum huttiense]|uniref:hypothetical protein n=1 Tax=Herbaspirillum huttiense TaxID=863372 RepID=UPI001AD078C1|nr:hypothetical protein [Herbaspirillum huttiense]MBN9356198.1 hypothetical protein [Herbaspirillum huttiense]